MLEKRNKKEMKDILQGEDTVKIIKSLRLRRYGHVERMQNQRMTRQTATATMEGARKTGRSRERWGDEVEEDFH
jgi:hypothetical protein